MRRSEDHTSELQSLRHLVCRLLLEKKKTTFTSRSSTSPRFPYTTPFPSVTCGRVPPAGNPLRFPGSRRSRYKTSAPLINGAVAINCQGAPLPPPPNDRVARRRPSDDSAPVRW